MKSENGYIIFDKTEDGKLSPHFSMKELRCQCNFNTCVEQRIAQKLLDNLELVRLAYGKPITPTSGFRCHERQVELAKSGKETATGKSTHELGHAADLFAKDIDALDVICQQIFLAVGKANTFIHVDLRDDKKRRWLYVKE